MDVSFVQVALIFVVTFIAAIDQFDFLESLYQPIVTGAIVGAILGDVQTGLVVGGTYQLMTIGNMPIGGAQPPNAVIGGIMAAVFACSLNMDVNVAVAAAIPFALLGQYGVTLFFTLRAPMLESFRAASILGVFVVGALTVTMGGTQINLTIPNGTTRGLAANTVIVSNEDAENFAGLEGIDTETAEPGTMALTDVDGNPLKAADAEGNAVDCGVVDLGNGMSSVTYGTVTETEVSYSVASTLDTVLPKLVPLALVLMLYFLFAKHNFTPIKGIVLLLIIGLLGAGPFGLWPSIW